MNNELSLLCEALIHKISPLFYPVVYKTLLIKHSSF